MVQRNDIDVLHCTGEDVSTQSFVEILSAFTVRDILLYFLKSSIHICPHALAKNCGKSRFPSVFASCRATRQMKFITCNFTLGSDKSKVRVICTTHTYWKHLKLPVPTPAPKKRQRLTYTVHHEDHQHEDEPATDDRHWHPHHSKRPSTHIHTERRPKTSKKPEQVTQRSPRRRTLRVKKQDARQGPRRVIRKHRTTTTPATTLESFEVGEYYQIIMTLTLVVASQINDILTCSG